MADRFERVVAGQEYAGPNADLHNAIVEVLKREYARKRILSEPYRDTSDSTPFESLPILILNASGGPLDQFAVVGLGDPITTPAENLDEFRTRLGFSSVSPDPGKPFAILQRPVPDGEADSAIIAGVSRCRIDMVDVNDLFAAPVADDYTSLVSQESGTARVLWTEPHVSTVLVGDIGYGGATLGGDITDSDTTISVSFSGTSPATPFTVAIEDELLNVSEVDGSTWTVDRGIHGTTGASHADGSGVSISGIVTTLVVASSDSVPALPFDVLIDLEQMTVTAISGTTWTVTRGVNWTITAPHADATAISGTGVVWGVVLLLIVDPPSGQAIFDINGAQGPGMANVAGTITWTCPDGVTGPVTFESWAPGGVGQLLVPGPGGCAAGGGGGGAYARTTTNAVPGRDYNVGDLGTDPPTFGVIDSVTSATIVAAANGMPDPVTTSGGAGDGGTGGQASDSTGDFATSGGHGGAGFYVEDDLLSTTASGGGGGGASTISDGQGGMDGSLQNAMYGFRALGGAGFAKGADGGWWNEDDELIVGYGTETAGEHAVIGGVPNSLANEPNGGGASSFAGIGLVDGLNGSVGRVLITWGNGGPTASPGVSITTGTLATGGTGTNLSGTGPGVVLQPSPGAPLSVVPKLPTAMGGMGIDASTATAGEVPIADGTGGFAMGTPGGGDGLSQILANLYTS